MLLIMSNNLILQITISRRIRYTFLVRLLTIPIAQPLSLKKKKGNQLEEAVGGLAAEESVTGECAHLQKLHSNRAIRRAF